MSEKIPRLFYSDEIESLCEFHADAPREDGEDGVELTPPDVVAKYDSLATRCEKLAEENHRLAVTLLDACRAALARKGEAKEEQSK